MKDLKTTYKSGKNKEREIPSNNVVDPVVYLKRKDLEQREKKIVNFLLP